MEGLEVVSDESLCRNPALLSINNSFERITDREQLMWSRIARNRGEKPDFFMKIGFGGSKGTLRKPWISQHFRVFGAGLRLRWKGWRSFRINPSVGTRLYYP